MAKLSIRGSSGEFFGLPTVVGGGTACVAVVDTYQELPVSSYNGAVACVRERILPRIPMPLTVAVGTKVSQVCFYNDTGNLTNQRVRIQYERVTVDSVVEEVAPGVSPRATIVSLNGAFYAPGLTVNDTSAYAYLYLSSAITLEDGREFPAGWQEVCAPYTPGAPDDPFKLLHIASCAPPRIVSPGSILNTYSSTATELSQLLTHEYITYLPAALYTYNADLSKWVPLSSY